jgi:NADH dehydrogenase
LYTALALAEQPDHPPLLLIEPNEHFLFLPLLYELLSGELRRWQIAPSYQSLLAGKGIGWLKDKVDRIDTNNRQVHTAQGHALSYSRLVLATGASSDAFGVPGVKEHALGFRTLADVERLQALVRSLRNGPLRGQRLAIVGGGPGGVELACKLADMLGDRAGIELIEQGASLLSESRAFNREQGQLALQRRGVRIRCGTKVLAVKEGQLELAPGDGGPAVHSPETLAVAAVIWTAGLRCQPPGLLPTAACDNRGRLLCSSDLRLQNHADIFVVGDLARIHDAPGTAPQDPVPAAPTTAQVAFQATLATPWLGKPWKPSPGKTSAKCSPWGWGRQASPEPASPWRVRGPIRSGGWPIWPGYPAYPCRFGWRLVGWLVTAAPQQNLEAKCPGGPNGRTTPQ